MSYDVSVTRATKPSTPDVLDDPGVVNLVASLESLLKLALPDDKIVAAIRTHLSTTYGANQVSERSDPPKYRWEWDEEMQVWVRIKHTRTRFLAADGEPDPLQVDVDLYAPA